MSLAIRLFWGLLFHFVGDYLFQTHWMAINKVNKFFPAFIHALVYSLPFILICFNWYWLIIFVTHFFIDRYRLAKYWVWFINRGSMENNGYPSGVPIWLSTWLLFIVDNTFHILINSSVIYLVYS